MKTIVTLILMCAAAIGQVNPTVQNDRTTKHITQPTGFWPAQSTDADAVAFVRKSQTNGAGGGGGAVDSVNGHVGTVILNSTDITEALNLYWSTVRSNNLFLAIRPFFQPSTANGTNWGLLSTNIIQSTALATASSATNNPGSKVNLTATSVDGGYVTAANSTNNFLYGLNGTLALDIHGNNRFLVNGDDGTFSLDWRNRELLGWNGSAAIDYHFTDGNVTVFTNLAVSPGGRFSGHGGGLTNVPAVSLTGSGTLPTGVLPSSVSLLGQTIDLASEVVGILPGNQAAFAPGSNITLTTNSGVVTIAGAASSPSVGMVTNGGTGTNNTFTSALLISTTNATDIRISSSGSSTVGLTNFGGALYVGSGASKADVIANAFWGSGANLTALPAAQLTGTWPASTMPAAVSNQINLNATNLLATGSLPAANLTGSIADARLSANVALLNAQQNFSGSNSFAASATALSNGVVSAYGTNGGMIFNANPTNNSFEVKSNLMFSGLTLRPSAFSGYETYTVSIRQRDGTSLGSFEAGGFMGRQNPNTGNRSFLLSDTGGGGGGLYLDSQQVIGWTDSTTDGTGTRTIQLDHSANGTLRVVATAINFSGQFSSTNGFIIQSNAWPCPLLIPGQIWQGNSNGILHSVRNVSAVYTTNRLDPVP